MKDHSSHSNSVIKLEKCIFLGKGRSGSVYLLPDGRAMKTFKNPDTCRDEYNTLQRLKNGSYFPKPFEFHNHYMIREYIRGINIAEYIAKNGLSRELILKIIDFLQYIKDNNFKKIDVRFAHIFIQSNGFMRVIDPRNSYKKKVHYPKHLFGDLKDIHRLSLFLKVLEEVRPDLYEKWYLKREKH